MIYVFEDYSLDTDRRELRCGTGLVSVEPQVFDFLQYLIAKRDRVVSKDEIIEGVWNGRIVSESTLSSRITDLRHAIGDSGETQRLIRTIPRRGLRFVGSVREEQRPGALDWSQQMPGRRNEADGAAIASISHAPSSSRIIHAEAALRQRVKFATASDGVQIAWASIGQGTPVLKGPNWLNHLEYEWHSPLWRPILEKLAKLCHLVRFDQRGNGLSDRDVETVSENAMVGDMSAVATAAGLDRFALLGISQGCAFSVRYAVEHPQQVTCLILLGGYLRGRLKRPDHDQRKLHEAGKMIIREGWGSPNPVFRHFFTSTFIPNAPQEILASFDELQRIATSPEAALRLWEMNSEVDVTELAKKVRVPTLVLHGVGDRVSPIEEGRLMAKLIPGTMFVELPGNNHLLIEGTPAFDQFFEEAAAFLAMHNAGA